MEKLWLIVISGVIVGAGVITSSTIINKIASLRPKT